MSWQPIEAEPANGQRIDIWALNVEAGYGHILAGETAPIKQPKGLGAPMLTHWRPEGCEADTRALPGSGGFKPDHR